MEYKLNRPDITMHWLKDNMFVYDEISSNGESAYAYRFTCYRYGDSGALDAVITVFMPSKNIRVDCYDHGTRFKFASFYYYDYGKYDSILGTVMSSIDSQLNRLGIENLSVPIASPEMLQEYKVHKREERVNVIE